MGDDSATATYEVFALKYAERDARRPDNFVGGDPHDAPMPMDYFIWLIRNDERLVLVDTGFDAPMAVKRGRRLLRTPREALRLIGVEANDVRTVLITHLHNDHVGTFFDFPNAIFHLQDSEMAYVTGRHMMHERLRRPYEPDHVAGVIRMVFKDRVVFHDGDGTIAPGVSVHHIGGHTAGLQCVRVMTKRGWVVLASDASHYYEHIERKTCFTVTFHIGEVLEGYNKQRRLAASPAHIVPGHDPLVLKRYPAIRPELEGIVVRLDAPPLQ
ncbi:MAG: fold metallo-hydrolase [Betaproteobacteria bacterium]|nr:fold metallo-hydrolase [Betaproteobacteria bacterium]